MATSPVVSSRLSLDDRRDPIVERVMANQFTLILGLIEAVVFGIVGLLLTGIVHARQGPNPLAGWPLLAFSAVILVVTLRQLLWPVPFIEVTSRGVRLRIRAPMRRSALVFVPWSHVRAVVHTQTVATPLKGGGREDGLGFQIIQDEMIRLPGMRWNSAHAAPEAPKCDVVFAASMVNGDVVEWVRKIEEHRIRAAVPRST